jgi:hypothetical protein
MTNLRKQLTAKTAWARMTDENRRLRTTLQMIADLAGRAERPTTAAVLRKIRELAEAALHESERKAA